MDTGDIMKRSWSLGFLLLLLSFAANAATRCPAIETALVGKGLGGGPWRVLSGGQAECTFMTADTSVNFGYNHLPSASVDEARQAAVAMRDAIAATSVVQPMPSLGEEGFAYQAKNDAGEVDPKSMFFYGHRGRLGVSAYLNLAAPITPAQRDFAASLVAGTLGAATNAKALAKETTCPYADAGLVGTLLPGTVATIAPDGNSCVLSADGRVVTIAIVKGGRSRDAAQGMMRAGGCSVDPLPQFGDVAGVLHHCFEGNERAQVVIASGNRMLEIAFVPGREPTDAERANLVELAAFALKH